MQNQKRKMKIIEDVVIIYIDGKKDFLRAIKQSKDGVITGRIGNNGKFIGGGFIAKINIKMIKTVPNNEEVFSINRKK